MLSQEQAKFILENRYVDVEANRGLFPEGLSHSDYVLHRVALQTAAGVEVAPLPPRDSRGRFIKTERPQVDLPSALDTFDGDKLWKAVQEFQKTHQLQIANHILTDVTIKIDTDRPFGIVFMSDWHIGSLGTDHEALMKDIDLINSCDNLMAYVGGDPTDNFVVDKLSHAARDNQVVTPMTQWRMFRHAIERLKPSLLAVGRGNHDAWTYREAGIDGIESALHGVPVLHTAEDTYIDLTVGETTYTIYRKHRPIGSSRTNRSAGAKRMYDLGKKTFDVGVTEHHHEASINCEQRHGEYRWFITTGSYKVSDSHAREWGFHHGGIGTPVVVFYPYRKKMVGYLSLEDAIEHLQ
jgi:hypothetical protein